MNPFDELRLRNEVIFLHSLWHQGPPTPSQPPPPNPIHLPFRILHNNAIPPSSSHSQPPPSHYIPQSQPLLRPHSHTHPFAPAHTRSLPPVASTAFKKKNKKKKMKKGKKDPPRSPGPEWPCPASLDPPATGWPKSKPNSNPRPPPPHEVSPQEKERLVALKAQNKACQAFREFLVGSDGDDDDDDDGDDGDSDDGLEEYEEFFVGVFKEDDELRGYYQRRFESGEFCCLVCGAVGKKKTGKRYKDCVGLVQHSMSVLRTVKRRAHRAFGQAVCKVLGWDIDRLPNIVMKGEPLLGVEMKPAEAEGEPKENVAAADDGKDASCKSDDIDPVEEHAQGVDRSIGECSSKLGDIDEKMDVGLENGGGAIYEVIEGEPTEKVDDDDIHKSDDKVMSLGHDDEPVEEHAQGVDQSISEVCHESLVSGAEWVCKNANCESSSTASGWPSFNTKSSSRVCSLSAEERTSVAVLQMQHKALEACQEYLGNSGSDCDDDIDNEDEDELLEDHDPEECEEFKFFLRLFTEDSDLRRYYENNHREGEFYCLVCGGMRKKIWKRFKDCTALLQHSNAIKRTKRMKAHRAYSRVICRVLGWDIGRLPAIVLMGESLGSSLTGSSTLLGEPEKHADGHTSDSNGEPEKPADSRIDNSNVVQENLAK